MTQQQPHSDNPFAKSTFRAVNESYLLFGVIDWRYGVIAVLPAIALWIVSRSKVTGLIGVALFQFLAYRIYSRDAAAPLVWVKTRLDKKYLCPFKE